MAEFWPGGCLMELVNFSFCLLMNYFRSVISLPSPLISVPGPVLEVSPMATVPGPVLEVSPMAMNPTNVRDCLKNEFTKPKIRSYAAEFMSAFFYCFCVYLSTAALGTSIDQILTVAIANAIALLVAMFIAAEISGGHVNPLISIATSFCGSLPLVQAILYCIFQTAGSILGCLVAYLVSKNIKSDKEISFYQPKVKALHGGIIESAMSFVLVFAFCAASLPRKPFVAALICGLNILILYPFSRGFVNPAFYVGASVVDGNFRNHPGYFWIPIAVAALGGWVYCLLFAPARPEGANEAGGGLFSNLLMNLFPQLRFYFGS